MKPSSSPVWKEVKDGFNYLSGSDMLGIVRNLGPEFGGWFAWIKRDKLLPHGGYETPQGAKQAVEYFAAQELDRSQRNFESNQNEEHPEECACSVCVLNRYYSRKRPIDCNNLLPADEEELAQIFRVRL